MSILRLLVLAHMQRRNRESLTRYDVMIDINQIASELDTPYSPGAVYHELSKLHADEMIIFNQSTIEEHPQGTKALHKELTENPLPKAIAPLLARCHAIQTLSDPEIRRVASKRISIEMININQQGLKIEHQLDGNYPDINIWRQAVRGISKKAILELTAN